MFNTKNILYYKNATMNTEKKEKPGTTIYINDEALEALNNVEIETM